LAAGARCATKDSSAMDAAGIGDGITDGDDGDDGGGGGLGVEGCSIACAGAGTASWPSACGVVDAVGCAG
ncbi:hypothetical protein, partial [Xanthomonas hortorum]|uniref:hypothetical protein n=1 Tax=Xanthomonas hortorum TaxID=56454 RepID=UPI002FE0ECB0